MARIIDFVLHAAKVRDIGRYNHHWLYRLYRLRMIMKTLFADDNFMGHGELVIDFPKKNNAGQSANDYFCPILEAKAERRFPHSLMC